MNVEMNFKSKSYWSDLSTDDKLKLLQEYGFGDGFSAYLWEYLPEDLKVIISLKIDLNEQIDKNTTMIV